MTRDVNNCYIFIWSLYYYYLNHSFMFLNSTTLWYMFWVSGGWWVCGGGSIPSAIGWWRGYSKLLTNPDLIWFNFNLSGLWGRTNGNWTCGFLAVRQVHVVTLSNSFCFCPNLIRGAKNTITTGKVWTVLRRWYSCSSSSRSLIITDLFQSWI